MKEYQIKEDGSYVCGSDYFPLRYKGRIDAEVLRGEATITDYTEPEPTVYQKMAALEATRTPRREREARLGDAAAQVWLDNLDDEIEALRP